MMTGDQIVEYILERTTPLAAWEIAFALDPTAFNRVEVAREVIRIVEQDERLVEVERNGQRLVALTSR